MRPSLAIAHLRTNPRCTERCPERSQRSGARGRGALVEGPADFRGVLSRNNYSASVEAFLL